MELVLAQKQQNPTKKTSATQQSASSTQEFGKSYATLRPEQKQLLDDYVQLYNRTSGSNIVPQEAYDNARLSVRTTFDAVTHALLNAKMTGAEGKSLGPSIDLVDTVDEVLGEESGVRGDRQFRVYVYLKPNAFDLLSSSQEFFRDKDNATYHKGFPICFRLNNGPPSIQFSLSRDKKMADIDVDYRSSKFPQALFNGHLTASNSDVRAGNNLDQHDRRWEGLSGWWREVFGQLGRGSKPPKEKVTENLGRIPLNPGVKANQGIDASAHDFLKTWVVDKQPNQSVAYFAYRSFPCLETATQNQEKPIPPGMVRLRTEIAMKKFADSMGAVNSVGDVFEPTDQWSRNLKEAKNAYASEFRLVNVPMDMAQDEECVAIPYEEPSKRPKETYYATAFRGTLGDSRNRVMSLLWTQELGYWKIIAIRLEDSSDVGILPENAAAQAEPSEPEPQTIAGDPAVVKAVTEFYRTWIGKRDTSQASHFVSQRSYECLDAESAAEKDITPIARIRAGLEAPLSRVPQGANLSDMMSSVQPVNEFLRPVEQENSKAFAIMAVPDQMADSFLCQQRHLPEKSHELKLAEAKYGVYYLAASQLNFGEEESPALLLLWSKEKEGWKIVAWAIEAP
jgi:hypothetical protein